MRKQPEGNKYMEQGMGLLKYCFTLLLLYFLVLNAPDQASQLVTTAGAFILGASKLHSKLGL